VRGDLRKKLKKKNFRRGVCEKKNRGKSSILRRSARDKGVGSTEAKKNLGAQELRVERLRISWKNKI